MHLMFDSFCFAVIVTVIFCGMVITPIVSVVYAMGVLVWSLLERHVPHRRSDGGNFYVEYWFWRARLATALLTLAFYGFLLWYAPRTNMWAQSAWGVEDLLPVSVLFLAWAAFTWALPRQALVRCVWVQKVTHRKTFREAYDAFRGELVASRPLRRTPMPDYEDRSRSGVISR